MPLFRYCFLTVLMLTAVDAVAERVISITPSSSERPDMLLGQKAVRVEYFVDQGSCILLVALKSLKTGSINTWRPDDDKLRFYCQVKNTKFSITADFETKVEMETDPDSGAITRFHARLKSPEGNYIQIVNVGPINLHAQ